MILVFVFIINLYTATCPPGTILNCIPPKHSSLYQKWKEVGNKNNYFYHPDTFGINIARDPCEKINSATTFKNFLNKKIIYCRGMWCKNGIFKCESGKPADCYQMEHIFDKNCENESNIWANVVMAYGRWNSRVSNRAMGGCANSLIEKKEIYGEKIINKIRNQINLCKQKAHKRNNQNDTEEIDEYIDEFDYSECDISCTCESDKYLDILCECDPSETDFDRSLCVDTSQPVEFLIRRLLDNNHDILGIVIGIIIIGVFVLIAFILGFIFIPIIISNILTKDKYDLVNTNEI